MNQKVTAQEAANILNYSRRHVYRLLKEGTLRAERFGQTWIIDRTEVERIKALQDVSSGRLLSRA